jgi:hypothetical protein
MGCVTAAGWPYPGVMGKLILGLIAAFIVVMLVLAIFSIVHAILSFVFFAAIIALVAFGVFKVARWSGRRGSREY